MYYEGLKNRIFSKMENVLSIYEKLVFNKVGELQNVCALTTAEHFRQVPVNGFAPVSKGYSWGGEWQNLWVKGDFTVHAGLEGKNLYVVSQCGGREQLFFLNGMPRGIFNSKNREFAGGNHASQFIGFFAAGEKAELAFECYAGHFDVDTDPYNNYEYPDIPAEDYMHTYNGVDICTRNDDIFNLIFDIRELLGAAQHLGDSFASGKAKKALERINEVLYIYPKHALDDEIKQGVKKALEISGEFFSGENSRVFGKVGVTGHSHMDTAWLWPVAETVRKCARTYSNALSIMEQYPEYNFIQSSALHGEWMKEYYPSIFEEMKKRTAEGRYEPNGGVYVECDCNITSGELMVRQFLKGQQFTRENFNYTSDSFWLPDTFGYNANIPQIMKGCEVSYFLTTKISWNELNKFPFESFVWKGIDGTGVLTHFARTHCWPDVDDCKNSVNDISLKDTTDMRLLAYGYGDGGGGPTPGMIETLRRARKTSGMPLIEPMSVSAFMRELETQKDNLPVYSDELYLELHRGTLTQMHNVKRKNRKAEYALRNMEYFNVLSGNARNHSSDKWLKILLKNQFHDILPGTSITPVYELYNKEMDELLDNYEKAAADYASSLTDNSEGFTLFNTLSFDRRDATVIEAPGYAANLPSQRYTDINGIEKLAVGGLDIPGFGCRSIELASEPFAAETPFSYSGNSLVTPFARITFDDNGYISSFVDTASGRELKKAGGEPLNVFLFGEDVPLSYDNWDIEKDAVDNLKPVCGFRGRELVSDGPVEIRLRSIYDIGEGTVITQDMVCYAGSPRVDFHTLVNWQSPHRLLKAGFDLDVNSKDARCEIQYGCVKRPTTENNSLEIAKFEVCNRNYTDVSEPGFGVALLNDCKYGISLSDCNLRLSLHRGGDHPDVTGDRGLHEMTYSLLPHNCGFGAESVVKPAYELNIPIVSVSGRADINPVAEISAPNVIVESLKPAEDGTASCVIRAYECEGTAAKACIRLNVPFEKAVLTNMLEDEKEALSVSGGCIDLSFRPFEIKTIKVVR